MTYTENEDLDPEDAQVAQIPAHDLRNLRKAAKERDEMAARLSSRDRELAFAKAKLDLEDPRIRYFIKGYDGELTSEAIRSQAEEDGFLSPPSNTKVDTSEEVRAQGRIANASAGANQTVEPNLVEKIQNAGSQEEVMALMIAAGYPTSWSTQ